jgi:hypothetical protein
VHVTTVNGKSVYCVDVLNWVLYLFILPTKYYD